MYNSREKDWFTRVHNTGWTQLVSYCLKTTSEILQWIVDRHCSVIITGMVFLYSHWNIIVEPEGKDVSAVLASLVQLCADPGKRTPQGIRHPLLSSYFYSLGIEHLLNKEWIALGHPFGERICGVGKRPSAPAFLLFLDCLSQMKRLYPTQ